MAATQTGRRKPRPASKAAPRARRRPPARAARDLAQRLQEKYRHNTNFLIAENDDAFLRTIAEELVHAIRTRIAARDSQDGLTSEKVRIGLICGRMAYFTAAWISAHPELVRGLDCRRIVFVAMNKAADADAFQLSANYLATYFAEVFRGSSAIAYTHNPYDRDQIDDHRRRVDILLCSAGGRSSRELNYLERWLDKRKGHGGPGPALQPPPGYIGEFCLTPIDESGWAVRSPEFSPQLEADLDPYPRFARLADLQNVTVIFPVNTSGPQREAAPAARHEPHLTGKELVTDVVLRSGAVTTCILPKPLAVNLAAAIGGHLLTRVSAPDRDKPVRRCQALRFSDAQLLSIPVYDPLNRIDETLCPSDGVLQAEKLSFRERPKILFSEYREEAARYDWTQEAGIIEFEVDNRRAPFSLTPDVRRPGQWSLVTCQIVAWLVRKHLSAVPASALTLWDMGCGCGAIGILAALSLPGQPQLLFSDIDVRAVDCARTNAQALLPAHAPHFATGDLFDVERAGRPRFHVVVFNPPFLPVQDLSINPVADAGGNLGLEIAERFCQTVYDHLEVGGWSVLALADYVDNGKILAGLQQRFGAGNVDRRERVILYPFIPERVNVPAAYEIRYQANIERACNYRFETCVIGGRRYLAFKMRHYLARRAE